MRSECDNLNSKFYNFIQKSDEMTAKFGEMKTILNDKSSVNAKKWKKWNVNQIVTWIHNLKDKNEQFAFRTYCYYCCFFFFCAVPFFVRFCEI